MEFTKVVAERYSCKNFQEQRIYVLQSEESLAKLDKVTPCRYGAPTCLVVAFDKNSVFTYPGGKRDSGVEDAAIVATHLMLAANAGVDSCFRIRNCPIFHRINNSLKIRSATRYKNYYI